MGRLDRLDKLDRLDRLDKLDRLDADEGLLTESQKRIWMPTKVF